MGHVRREAVTAVTTATGTKQLQYRSRGTPEKPEYLVAATVQYRSTGYFNQGACNLGIQKVKGNSIALGFATHDGAWCWRGQKRALIYDEIVFCDFYYCAIGDTCELDLEIEES